MDQDSDDGVDPLDFVEASAASSAANTAAAQSRRRASAKIASKCRQTLLRHQTAGRTGTASSVSGQEVDAARQKKNIDDSCRLMQDEGNAHFDFSMRVLPGLVGPEPGCEIAELKLETRDVAIEIGNRNDISQYKV